MAKSCKAASDVGRGNREVVKDMIEDGGGSERRTRWTTRTTSEAFQSS